MSTTTITIEEKKSWWDTIKDTADDVVHFTTENSKAAWEIAKDNPVATVVLMGGGFCLASKAWVPAATLTIIGTAMVTINEFNKIVLRDAAKAAFINTWKAMTHEQRVAAMRMYKPDASDEEINDVINTFNMENGIA